MRVLAIVLTILFTTQLFAATVCESSLTGERESIFRSWSERLQTGLHLRRPLSMIEYEATMDATHGLPVVVTLADGAEARIVDSEFAIEQLRVLLRLGPLKEVRYLPEAKVSLNKLYASAEGLLRRKSLTEVEKQTLRWFTFHKRQHSVAARGLIEQGVPEEAVRAGQNMLQDQTLSSAHRALYEVFGPRDGEILYLGLVEDDIRIHFQRFLEAYLAGQ